MPSVRRAVKGAMAVIRLVSALSTECSYGGVDDIICLLVSCCLLGFQNGIVLSDLINLQEGIYLARWCSKIEISRC
jgi:hypothetical protein